MAPSTVVLRKDVIFELLSDKSSVNTIVLVGDSGVGKTWTARQISNCAVKKGLFEIALWVFLERDFDGPALCNRIARQLPLLSTAEVWEAEDGNKEADKEMEIHKASQIRISNFLEGKRFLLILDNGRNETDEKDMLSQLIDLLNLRNQSSYKVIITSAKSFNSYAPMENERVILLTPLSVEESLSLLREKIGRRVYDDPPIKALARAFIKKTKYLPGSIILMAKAVSYFSQHDSGLRVLKRALEEASDDKSYGIMQLLHSGYNILPRNVLIDCFRHGNHFFRDSGSIHYNELIAYWILEGYFGHVDSIDVAYENGHSVLMELVDCQVLKKLEGGYVIMDRAILSLDEYDRYGFGGTASLGLADLFADREWEGFGRITQTDGMIKSLGHGKKGQKLSTLFLSGSRCVEILDDVSLGLKQEINVLALFNPTFRSLTQLLSNMHELFVLVLRDCVFLENIGKFEFKRLTVLEISNASSLKNVPNDFFEHMLYLRSLHISELKVDPLPSSIEDLKELRWLILRDCSSFKTLNSLKNFKNLMVLDVSGATSLVNFKDKAFKHTPKLQTINLSRTSIKRLPKLLNLGELTHVSLSGCESLDRLPNTDLLSSLQTLDLSGARGFKEFHEQLLGKSGGLKILDLSETPLENLPSRFNPRCLLLKRCSQLKRLTCIEAIEDLEVLDLLGTKSLVEIEEKFFSNPKSLQILNLSETGIKTLPSLINACGLRRLLLSDCSSLTVIEDESFEQMPSLEHLDLSGTMIRFLPRLSNPSILSVLSLKDCTKLSTLPPLEHLTNLQDLNLCGVVALEKTGAGFLEHMSHIQILDLSETSIAELPPMSNLKSLKKLFLRCCKNLQTVKNLGELTTLEVLDLSETGVTQIPSVDSFSNLRQLLLGGCSSLEGFLVGNSIRDLPYGISKLTNLEYLDLPKTKNIRGAESRNTKSQQAVVDPYQWTISTLPDETPGESENPPISFSGIQFLQSLKENPTLVEASLKRFHFCVYPTKAQTNCYYGDVYPYRNDLVFRDIRFRTTEFDRFKEQRTLEIHGFNFFPIGIEDVLCNADCVFFINNTFNNWSSNIDVSSLKEMKGCWIERCTEMEDVYNAGKEEDVVKPGKALEFLGVSNAINLHKLPCWEFENLRSLYVDCCPKLSNVFSTSQLPENLKVLQIKFCDKLESMFEITSPEPELRNLETLYLWELPELKSIGCRLPSLQTLKVWDCPKLQKLEDSIRSVKKLQTLWISNVVDLKSIYSGSHPESLRNLETLVVECCPMLKNVLSTPQAPESLKTLKIKSCNQLKTVLEHDKASDCILQKLKTLHLYKLPILEKIGGKLPAIEKPIVIDCPNCRDSALA